MKTLTFESDPQSYLNLFNKRLFKFYKSTEFFNDEKLKTSIRELLKKTVISEMLYDNQFISISGMQGVGKSTILANLYNLPEGVIPKNLERGERLPILLTERNGSETIGKVFAYKINEKEDGHIKLKKEITTQDFYKRCLSPESDDIFLEIEVPNNVFETEGLSFLLLPGLEDPELIDSTERWQELVKLSLILSSNTVFVFNETKYADLQNRVTLDFVKEQFKESKPLFCLSFADQSKDENRSLRESVRKDYEILDSDFERIVITGISDELRVKWPIAFKKAINKYSRTEAGFRKKQLEYLNQILKSEVPKILLDFEVLKSKKAIELKVQNNEYQDFIEVFDKEVEDMRRGYMKEVTGFLNEYSIKPFEKLDSDLESKGFFKKLKEMFLGKSIKQQREFEREIMHAWDNANGFRINEVYPNVLTRIVSRRLYMMGYNEDLMKPPLKLHDPLGRYDEKLVESKLLPANAIDNIAIIGGERVQEEPFKPSPEAAIKLIPVLALEILRFTVTLGNAALLTENTNASEFRNHIEEVANDYESMKDTHSRVMLASAALLGIDISDGTVNSIPAILSALGVELSENALALLNAAIAAGIVGIIAVSIFKHVNKLTLEERDYLRSSMTILKDYHNQRYLEIFEDIMSAVRVRLASKLSSLYLRDKDHHRFENAKRFARLVDESQLLIREQMKLRDIL